MRDLLILIVVVAGAFSGLATVAVSQARANTYNGMLFSGTLEFTSITDYSWTAPSTTQFGGFAYTGALFQSWSYEKVGGLAGGFVGTGGSAPATLLFPWTDDCTITHTGHYWTNSGGTVSAGTDGQDSCLTTGNSSGWNYDNVELESTAPAVNPQSEYQTLKLESWCQAASCSADDSVTVEVQNLSASINDPNNQPSGSASWTSAVSGSDWYQTDSNAPTLAVSASDPAGVCDLTAGLSGPAGYTSPNYGAVANGTTDPGPPIGEEFGSATDPCSGPGGSVSGTWTLPAGMDSGTYTLSVHGANPGNYAAQGYGGGGSPALATYGDAINVDDTVPALAVEAGVDGSSGTLTVTTGPSGIGSVSCTQAGQAVTLTQAGRTGDVFTYDIPTATAGLNCQASNGDANGALSASIDTPSITFTDPEYSEGAWTGQAQLITVTASGSDATVKSCTLDGALLSTAGTNSITGLGSSAEVVEITSSGPHSLVCAASVGGTTEGNAQYTVDIDTQQPTVAFSGATPGTWYSNTDPASTATVIATASEATTYSGISGITCTINGGIPFTLSGVGGGIDSGSFVVTPNGANTVACYATSGAGLSGPHATEVIDIDDPNIPVGGDLSAYGSSSLIDDGADPFSDGPSQTVWYRTAQSVTITANDTGGDAPISSIACIGAPTNGTGTWPNSGPNTDSVGGEQITVTVQPPGGDLVCSATDSAGNTYPLGSYEFQEDDTAPGGAFVAQSRWPEPDELELKVTDAGSGVAYVRVYAQLNGAGVAAQSLGAATSEGNGVWMVQVPDGSFPPGRYTFYANDADAAGNTGQITAGPDGGIEELRLPLREQTTVTMQAASVSATEDAAAPTVLVPVLGVAVAGSAAGSSLARAVGRLPAHALTPLVKSSKAKPVKVLDVAYGKAVTVRGRLHNDKLGLPIAGAVIDIYQQVISTSRVSLIGQTSTNARGRYSYQVAGGASRLVFVAYPGTQKLRSAVAQLEERFTGLVTLHASAISAGGELVLSGRVEGGHIPTGGVIVTADYQQVGLPGRGTFGTVRTNAQGVWRFVQPFSPLTAGFAYRLWVTVPGRQPGWPYLSARSRDVVRHIG